MIEKAEAAVVELAHRMTRAERTRGAIITASAEEFEASPSIGGAMNFLMDIKRCREREMSALMEGFTEVMALTMGTDLNTLVETLKESGAQAFGLDPENGEVVMLKDGEAIPISETSLADAFEGIREEELAGPSTIDGIDLSRTYDPRGDADEPGPAAA